MTTDTDTFGVVANAHGVTFSATLTDSNPFFDDAGSATTWTHWRCVMTTADGRRTFEVVYSMGSGHDGREPSAAEVLESLTDDLVMHDNCGGKWDYFSDYGITPSEKAERDYLASKAQSEAFFDFASGPFLRDLRDALDNR